MADRIDWENLPTLPSKRTRDSRDRELLAEVRFNRQKAKHKGRCHLSNAKRRQIAAEKKEKAQLTAGVKKGKFQKYIDQVRAYWRGEADAHPGKPS